MARDRGTIAVLEKPFPIEGLVRLVTQNMGSPKGGVDGPVVERSLHVIKGHRGG
jgi:hypothetical protein